MLIELWFKKFDDYARRILNEGRVEKLDGRDCFVHPDLRLPRVPDWEGGENEGADLLARMLVCEAVNTHVVRVFLDLDRRMRSGQLPSGALRMGAVRNSLARARALRDRARKALRALFGHDAR